MIPLELVCRAWKWLRRRYRCWQTRHDLTVYVSPLYELPSFITCDCGHFRRLADLRPLSDWKG